MIVDKLQLIDNIKREIPNNSTGAVSPNDVRHNLLDIIDSVHLFTDDNNLNSLNFSTPDVRTTKAGIDTIKNLYLAGYSSTDNSAFGYFALGNNYDGFSNTAIGSYAMSCNLYGDNNSALGFQALTNNIYGSGNVAIGSNALRSNKEGNYNIAIGHAAGHYIGTNSSYNFYLGSHNIDESGVCDNPLGSGLVPLMRGDLYNLVLAIGTDTLHNYGTLQVAGTVSPSESGIYDLGHEKKSWRNLFVSDVLEYPDSGNFSIRRGGPEQTPGGGDYVKSDVIFLSSGGLIGLGTNLPSGDEGLVTSRGNIVPLWNTEFSLGTPDLRWDAHFGNITISGTADVTTFNYTEINSCIYECRTLYLASSGDICVSGGGAPCGWLQDQQIEGGGFVLQSSGIDYRRDYEFIFTSTDATLTCLEMDSPYSRSAWNSNISIHIASGSHLKTDRIIGRKNLSMISCGPSGYGIFVKGVSEFDSDTDLVIGSTVDENAIFFGTEDLFKPDPRGVDSRLANVSNINFVGSGEVNAYRVTYSSLSSGVTVGQRLVSRTMRKEVGSQGEHIVGFGIDYVDTKNTILDNQATDRLVISAYDDTPTPLNAFIIMRSSSPGLVGITNSSDGFNAPLPNTITNIQATGDAILRVTSASGNKSSLQLLSPENSGVQGFELDYNFNQSTVDLSVFQSGVRREIIALDWSKDSYHRVGINTTSPNETLTIDDRDVDGSGSKPVLSIREMGKKQAPSITSEFGKIYISGLNGSEQYWGGVNLQTQAPYFMDDAGNRFDLSLNIYDVSGAKGVYTDSSGNTFAGRSSPSSREAHILGYERRENTSFGDRALNKLTNSRGNSAFGYLAGYRITSGSGNTLVGNNTGRSLVGGSHNVIIGHNALKTSDNDVSNSIIIGTEEIGRGTDTDYTILIGANEDNIILDGLMGPSVDERFLSVPRARFIVTSDQGVDQLVLRHYNDQFDDGIGSIIEKVDTINDQVQGGVAFTFRGADDTVDTIFTLRHNANAMSTYPSYYVPSPIRPVAELKGDLNLLGSVRFSDGTSIGSTSGIITIPGVGLSSYIDTTAENEVFNLNIEEMSKATDVSTVSSDTSYLALSTGGTLGKMKIVEFATYLDDTTSRILNNYNHAFTNTSTIDAVNNTYNNMIGYKSADNAVFCDFTSFIGPEAGLNASGCDYSNFVGYRTGYGTVNASHSVFIGSSAGYDADNSQYAVFIGDSAGQFASSQRSIGIGDNALEAVSGSLNIELTVGAGGTNRLIGGGVEEINNKIALGTTIAGDMSLKRMSIGEATINPSATLVVRAESSDNIVKVQEWERADGATVAHLDQGGIFNATGLTIGDAAILEAELEILDGATVTTAELNILDGATLTTGELNILDGVTSTAGEINILDGVTITTEELNILDGDNSATATVVVDADRVVLNDNGTMVQCAVDDLKEYMNNVRTVTTSHTADTSVTLVNTSDNSCTITLPSSTPAGTKYAIKMIGDGDYDVTIYSASTIDGASSKILTDLYQVMTVVSDGTSYHILHGISVHP